MSSDKDWKNWGNKDPYFGVVTHDEYRLDKITDDTLNQFFESGEEYVDHVFNILADKFHLRNQPQIVVDFGCGTGRLSIPLAKRSTYVIGLDISEGMLDEATKNTNKFGFDNIDYRLVTDDNLSVLTEKADLIHSYIVFQHIPIKRGEQVFASLLSHLEIGGCGVIHFTIASQHTVFRQVLSTLRNRFPILHSLFNIIQAKRFDEPKMRMGSYNVTHLIEIMHKYKIEQWYCERTNHGGHIGLIFYFKRSI